MLTLKVPKTVFHAFLHIFIFLLKCKIYWSGRGLVIDLVCFFKEPRYSVHCCSWLCGGYIKTWCRNRAGRCLYACVYNRWYRRSFDRSLFINRESCCANDACLSILGNHKCADCYAMRARAYRGGMVNVSIC